MCPKTGPPARPLFIKVVCNSGDPGTLFFELSPAREHDFQKNGLITKSCKKTSQSTTKWKPQASILSPRVKQLPFVGKQNAVRKIAPKKSPKKSRGPRKSGMGGSLKFN